MTCLFCNKVTKGGIHRVKQHQVGNFKNITECLKCPDLVREELAHYMAEKKTEKENYDKMLDFDDIDNMIEIEDVNDDKVEEVEVIQKGKNHTIIRRGKTGSSGRVASQVGLTRIFQTSFFFFSFSITKTNQ